MIKSPDSQSQEAIDVRSVGADFLKTMGSKEGSVVSKGNVNILDYLSREKLKAQGVVSDLGGGYDEQINLFTSYEQQHIPRKRKTSQGDRSSHIAV